MSDTIKVHSGKEMEETAKRIAKERGLIQRTRRGHGSGLFPIGPSITLHDNDGNTVVTVVYERYR